MKKVFYMLFSLFLLTSSGEVFSQNAYKITVKTNAFTDTVCYLYHYYGKFQMAVDTAYFNNKGIAIFEKKDKALERGIYFIFFPNKKHLDFVVNQDQVITFQVDTNDISRNTKVTGSRENQLFYEYNNRVSDIGLEIDAFKKLEEKYKDSNEDSLKIVQEKIISLNKKLLDQKQLFIDKNPGSLVSKVFLLTKDPDLPEPPLREDGKPDSVYLYNYYKNNYWENMDFSDDALVRTPVFHARLERFTSSVIVQHPDSVIREIDNLVKKTEHNRELFKYVVWFLTFHYETSSIMGHDAVFVHLVDTYYRTGKAFWASETVLNKILERADKLRPILIGKIAPNMALMDTSLTSYSQLWQVDANYTVMIFWDPDCGHCKREVEKLNSIFIEQGDDLGIKIYSVCADTSLVRWKNMIDEKGISEWINVNGTRSALGHYQQLYDVFSTPLIYVLDREKKIIAKRLAAENVPAFIKQFEAIKREENEKQN